MPQENEQMTIGVPNPIKAQLNGLLNHELNTQLSPEKTILAEKILNELPQTQCTKCGYAGCRAYANAIADDKANYNQCPPGGQEGVARLAAVLKRPVIALNIEHGIERVRRVAVINPNQCIGCTLCIQACPTDAIIGASKHLHIVLEADCTGCDLCVAPCPVDCISMQPIPELQAVQATGWQAWSAGKAQLANQRFDEKLARKKAEVLFNQHRAEQRKAQKQAQTQNQNQSQIDAQNQAEKDAQKKAIIQAAMQRAKQQLST